MIFDGANVELGAILRSCATILREAKLDAQAQKIETRFDFVFEGRVPSCFLTSVAGVQTTSMIAWTGRSSDRTNPAAYAVEATALLQHVLVHLAVTEPDMIFLGSMRARCAELVERARAARGGNHG